VFLDAKNWFIFCYLSNIANFKECDAKAGRYAERLCPYNEHFSAKELKCVEGNECEYETGKYFGVFVGTMFRKLIFGPLFLDLGVSVDICVDPERQ
jgi:hypothetical protein